MRSGCRRSPEPCGPTDSAILAAERQGQKRRDDFEDSSDGTLAFLHRLDGLMLNYRQQAPEFP